jgi:hypothetical protein
MSVVGETSSCLHYEPRLVPPGWHVCARSSTAKLKLIHTHSFVSDACALTWLCPSVMFRWEDASPGKPVRGSRKAPPRTGAGTYAFPGQLQRSRRPTALDSLS